MRRMEGRWRRAWAACVLAIAGFGVARAAVDEKDLLPVDQAFAFSANASSADEVQLQWAIADGYYLYRHRISVRAQDGTPVGTLALPKGDRHTDPFFGEVETYRRALRATLPVTASGDRVVLQV